MDFTLLHPKLVHLPIALAVLVPLIAAGLATAIWKDWLPSRVWVVAIALQAILVVGGVAALKTGEVDEEVVEQVVPESALEQHEEAAELFVWGAGLLLAVFVVAGFRSSTRPAKLAMALSIVGSIVVLGLGYRVGQFGGDLVYRHNAGSAWTQSGQLAPTASPGSALRDDDDDD